MTPDPEADTRGVEALSDEERRAGVKLGLLLGHAMTVHSGVPSPGPNTLRMAREVLAAAGVPETHQELDTIRRAWLDSRAEVQRLRAALGLIVDVCEGCAGRKPDTCAVCIAAAALDGEGGA